MKVSTFITASCRVKNNTRVCECKLGFYGIYCELTVKKVQEPVVELKLNKDAWIAGILIPIFIFILLIIICIFAKFPFKRKTVDFKESS